MPIPEDIQKAAEDLKKIPEIKSVDTKRVFERVETGIMGFDELIQGGIPKGSLILLTGGCGTGKSTFGVNFLVTGIEKYNEPGIYITMEEEPKGIVKQMKQYGWDLEKYMKEDKLKFISTQLYDFDKLLIAIEDAVDQIKAKRLVLDSITVLGFYFKDEFKIRKAIMEMGRRLKKLGCTSLLISEIPEGSNKLSTFGVEEYVVDGVIILYLIKKETTFLRAIAIRKMRGTNHSTKIHPIMFITPGGIKVFPAEEVFAEV